MTNRDSKNIYEDFFAWVASCGAEDVRLPKEVHKAEWIEWALENHVDEMIITAMHQFPHVMQSYIDQSYIDDPKGDNPYIFNPKRNTGAFASPRSLQKGKGECDNDTRRCPNDKEKQS